MSVIESHYCRKHKLSYECTIWSPKPKCPLCWREKQERIPRVSRKLRGVFNG